MATCTIQSSRFENPCDIGIFLLHEAMEHLLSPIQHLGQPESSPDGRAGSNGLPWRLFVVLKFFSDRLDPASGPCALHSSLSAASRRVRYSFLAHVFLSMPDSSFQSEILRCCGTIGSFLLMAKDCAISNGLSNCKM